jgi:hypothetical protein
MDKVPEHVAPQPSSSEVDRGLGFLTDGFSLLNQALLSSPEPPPHFTGKQSSSFSLSRNESYASCFRYFSYFLVLDPLILEGNLPSALSSPNDLALD